jgi:hypothetical protein
MLTLIEGTGPRISRADRGDRGSLDWSHGKLGLGVRSRNVWNGRWWVHVLYSDGLDHSPLMFVALMIGRISLRLDVRLADDAAVPVIFFANLRGEIRAADADQLVIQVGKPRLSLALAKPP